MKSFFVVALLFAAVILAAAASKAEDEADAAEAAFAASIDPLKMAKASATKLDSSFAFLSREYDKVRHFYRESNMSVEILPGLERRMVAQNDLSAFTVLFDLPHYLLINKERVLKIHPEYKDLVAENGIGIDNLMALFVARVRSSQDNGRSDDKSVFEDVEYSFLHELPGNCRNGFHFNEEMYELMPPWLKARALNANMTLNTYFDANVAYQGKPTDRPYGVSLEQFREALCLFLANSVEMSQGERSILPFLNYIRNVGDSSLANAELKFDPKGKKWIIFLNRNVTKGEEITVHHANTPGAQQLMMYGTYDRAVVNANSTSGLVPELGFPAPAVNDTDPLKEEKEEMLKLIPTRYFALGWKFNNTVGFAPEVLRLFRLLYMNASDFSQFTLGTDMKNTKEIRGRMTRYVHEGVAKGSSQLSPKNEELLFDHLFNFCSVTLAAIPDESISWPQQAADKKLLANLLRLIEDHRHLLSECKKQLGGQVEKVGRRIWLGTRPAADELAKYKLSNI